jgi:hypothetical protein
MDRTAVGELQVTKHDFQDQPPAGAALTAYDKSHARLYLRLLDAEADGAPWQEIVAVLFGLNATDEPERASRVYTSHLARAKWMSENGFGQLLGSHLH